MRDLMTADDYYSWIIMFRSADSRTVVLLEGDTDRDCLGPHIDHDHAIPLACTGKRNLLRVVEIAETTGTDGIVGICDRDWDGIVADEVGSDNIVYTDLYDLDSTIIVGTEITAKVAYVYGDHERVIEHCNDLGVDGPVDVAVRLASMVGYLRLASHKAGLGLALRGFPMHEVIHHDGSLSREKLLTLVILRSPECDVSQVRLEQLLAAEEATGVPPERVCNGHDLGAVLASLCRSRWGGSTVGASQLLTTMRVAVNCASLRTLSLYDDIIRWELENGVVVLHQGCRAA